MLKLFAQLIAVFCLVFVSNTSFASQDSGTIKSVFVFKTSIGFVLNGGFINAKEEFECNGYFATIDTDENENPLYKQMISAIYTAYALGREIRVNVDSCSGNYARVSGIYLESQ